MACSKDCKKFGLAVVAGFVTLTALEFVVHTFLLGPVYKKPHYASLWNPEAAFQARMWAMFLAYFVSSVAFTKLYAGGYEEGKPWCGQGLRFGTLAGLFLGSYYGLVSYMVYPVSLKLAGAWAASLTAVFAAVGVAVAAVYRPHSHAPGEGH